MPSFYNPHTNAKTNAATLVDSVAELEAAIHGIQDYRRASKDKLASIEYLGALAKTFDLSHQVQRDADFNILATNLSMLIQTKNSGSN